MKDAHFLVVGAGIGGLTAAAALQRAGARVTVFEQAPELKEIGAGVIITPQAMHSFDYLGIADRVAAEAGPAECYHSQDYATGEILLRGPSSEEFRTRFGAGFHQCHRADLHSALADAAAAGGNYTLHLGHRFVGATQEGGRVTATFANGLRYEADALIGCDGNASLVRTSTFGSEPVKYTEQVAYRAVLDFDRVPKALLNAPYSYFVGPGRMLLFYPLRNRKLMNVIGIAHEPDWQEEGWIIPATRDEFVRLYQDFHPAVLALLGALPEDAIFKWALRDREPLSAWTQGRITMLGDAAHPMTPFLGQGACLAIEDGIVLARAVDQASTVGEAFALYEGARKQRTTTVQLASRDRGRDLQGRKTGKAGPGQNAESMGLFAYNPATVPL
ncbi:FAD-dependent monooxygenase [Sphingobium sp. BS19]|uniref:FAD-dependent monooxygenase n=1 Tax=Sphingobium sp. BS19 TaxID=3018973 RepID=UPI0022EDDDA3|nr:FAD-dependent monooxygenase [Sphingobium sp. BS19]GLJ00264.1 monooxygenase [Sphingobium sp. BS19]